MKLHWVAGTRILLMAVSISKIKPFKDCSHNYLSTMIWLSSHSQTFLHFHMQILIEKQFFFLIIFFYLNPGSFYSYKLLNFLYINTRQYARVPCKLFPSKNILPLNSHLFAIYRTSKLEFETEMLSFISYRTVLTARCVEDFSLRHGEAGL